MISRMFVTIGISICVLSSPLVASPKLAVSVAKPTLKQSKPATKSAKIVHPLLLRVQDTRKKLKQPPKVLKGFDLSGAMRAPK